MKAEEVANLSKEYFVGIYSHMRAISKNQKKETHFGYSIYDPTCHTTEHAIRWSPFDSAVLRINDPICHTTEHAPKTTSKREQVTCWKCLKVLEKYEQAKSTDQPLLWWRVLGYESMASWYSTTIGDWKSRDVWLVIKPYCPNGAFT